METLLYAIITYLLTVVPSKVIYLIVENKYINDIASKGYKVEPSILKEHILGKKKNEKKFYIPFVNIYTSLKALNRSKKDTFDEEKLTNYSHIERMSDDEQKRYSSSKTTKVAYEIDKEFEKEVSECSVLNYIERDNQSSIYYKTLALEDDYKIVKIVGPMKEMPKELVKDKMTEAVTNLLNEGHLNFFSKINTYAVNSSEETMEAEELRGEMVKVANSMIITREFLLSYKEIMKKRDLDDEEQEKLKHYLDNKEKLNEKAQALKKKLK